MIKSKRMITYLVIIALSVNIMFIMGGYGVMRQAQRAIYNEKVNYLKEISYKTAQNIESYINGHIDTLNSIASFVGMQNTIDADTIMPILKSEVKNNDFKRMGIIYPDGNAVTTDNIIFYLGDREYFAEAMHGTATVSNTMLIDKADGNEINVMAAPVYKDGEIVCVVFATKTQEEFSNMLKIESFGGEGYSYVITAAGSPVARTTHPGSISNYTNLYDEMIKTGLSEEYVNSFKQNIQHGRSGLVENTRNGIKRQICYTKVDINDWYIISLVPSEIISHETDGLIVSFMTFMLLIFLVTGIFSFKIISILNKKNRQLETIAYVDKITGYANWDKFSLDVKNALAKNEKNKNDLYAAVAFDINKFKVINDLFGYKFGNNVLRGVANVAKKSIHTAEFFSRRNSDVFVLLIHYENQKEIVSRLEELAEKIENIVDDYKIEISAGIYLIDEAGEIENLNDDSIDTCYDRANIARNVVKHQNDIFYSFFDEKNLSEIIREKEIENVMKDAVKNKEFEVYLQPKYSLKTEKIVGAEALVRWNRKGVGLVQPNDFIPLFEKNGFIRTLDLYMFEQVCILIAEWVKDDRKIVPISVNLSRAHLSDSKLPQKLYDIVSKYNIDTSLLEVELTESAIYSDTENMKSMLKSIKKLGIHLSIDDFGSGYSSLSSLKDLPVDLIKLDKSFLDSSLNDKRGDAIICNVINMAKFLGLLTVAEGVETYEQVELLKAIECDIAQGYFYSPPIPIKRFENMIELSDT